MVNISKEIISMAAQEGIMITDPCSMSRINNIKSCLRTRGLNGNRKILYQLLDKL